LDPLLEAGDRLSRDEFERRYERLPCLKKAELIEGIVYMPSPVRVKKVSRQCGHELRNAGSGTPRNS
jgi:uncharacterized protein YktB (UPF0637 family)